MRLTIGLNEMHAYGLSLGMVAMHDQDAPADRK